MSTFVLVPGFWLGAWAWRGVVEPLRAAGHTAYPVTLTGLADRAHLAGPSVDLDTHIADVVNLITHEDLHDVVLVGHSGSGIVVTGAADRIPERIARVVYVDSGPVADGLSQFDLFPPHVQEETKAGLVDGWRHPFPSWARHEANGASLAGLGEVERAAMTARVTDHPAGAITQPLTLTGAGAALPKTLVTCSFPLEQVRAMIEARHPYFAALAGPEWDFHELPTGHWPMFSRPADTAEVLIKAA
ncbi:alpha/beta hydrolase [Solihabitans fulvus]|uniref:Alpha/beta hydrolase n=1 Tax=Solihabitans fulvus TaxID=1892852 RepID=A0A5B2XD06_9PSEU|nr:alpha/beta hydrolase [Solihabitans fulvus]KAA2261618.1 alpha/beta hydrolase [Solihabitans fulvus]